jgi:small subunit ribosomal protein S21
MLIVEVQNNNIEKALKQYKHKVIKTKQIKTLREDKEFEKKSSRKRKQIAKAKYLQSKLNLQDQ